MIESKTFVSLRQLVIIICGYQGREIFVEYFFPRVGEKDRYTVGERSNQTAGMLLRNKIQGSLLCLLNELISAKQTSYSLFI